MTSNIPDHPVGESQASALLLKAFSIVLYSYRSSNYLRFMFFHL
jgi:hypothetical protein